MYTPSTKIIDKYADVLINFALNSGKGIRKEEVVFLQVPECAKPFLVSLRKAVLKAGGFPIIEYFPDDIARGYYELANEAQLKFFPKKYLKGKVDEMDHIVGVIADTNLHELEGIDPKKIMTRSNSFMPYKKWRDEKEYKGKMTWTLALWTTPAMAKEAKLTEKEYWDEIIKACYLDKKDPVGEWKKIFKEIDRVKAKLNRLEIEWLHIKAKGTDLTVKLGSKRLWMGGDGRNIPSYEVFISPDWRGTEGTITFTEPLYRYGNLIEGVSLTFKGGKVVKATAKRGEKILKEMIKAKDANKIGEFSLTDCRLSRITKFMAETLFDENVGGKYGNTHIALGSAYKDSYPGDPSKVTKETWKKLGYNDSVVHTDIVATSDRVVVATLRNGEEKEIYRKGKFSI